MTFLILLGMSCGDGSTAATDPAPAPVEGAIYSGEWDIPTREHFQSLDLPPGPEGYGYEIVPLTYITVWADPTRDDPRMDAGACGQLIRNCFSPGERNLHGCFLNVPHCEDTDDFCCPAACTDAFLEARETAVDEVAAAVAAIWGEFTCIEGL